MQSYDNDVFKIYKSIYYDFFNKLVKFETCIKHISLDWIIMYFWYTALLRERKPPTPIIIWLNDYQLTYCMNTNTTFSD